MEDRKIELFWNSQTSQVKMIRSRIMKTAEADSSHKVMASPNSRKENCQTKWNTSIGNDWPINNYDKTKSEATKEKMGVQNLEVSQKRQKFSVSPTEEEKSKWSEKRSR